MQFLSEKDVMKQVKKYLKEKVAVNIYYNNEIGRYVWSVTVVSEPEFWLDSFKYKKGALEFCKKHNLKVLKVIK